MVKAVEVFEERALSFVDKYIIEFGEIWNQNPNMGDSIVVVSLLLFVIACFYAGMQY